MLFCPLLLLVNAKWLRCAVALCSKLLQAKKLAEDVAELFRNVLRLHVKMARARTSKSGSSSSGLRGSASMGSSSSASGGSSSGGPAAGQGSSLASESEDETLEAAELTDYSPRQLSFWIAHAFTVRNFDEYSGRL